MRNLDLNLLPPLQVLLELKNISRAAERLQLSQPATSAAMARLRRHFDDELLVRNGRTYDLTPFAQSLVPLVDEALLHIQRATRVRSGFDPGTSEREFIIAASDYAAALIVGPLRGILRDEAPGVSVDFMPTSKSGIQGQLADYSKIDLLVGPTGYHMQGASRQLFRDSFVVVADAASSLLQRPRLTLEDLVTVPHAVGYFGEGISTPADKLFESLGLQRRVAAVVAGFLSLPLLVEGTDLVALVPRMLAARAARGANIAVLEFADDTEASLVEAMYWHPSQTEDPASVWLRSVVQRSCGRLQELFPVEAHPVVIGAAKGQQQVQS
ncbi:transcriptional regulator, LysR family [Pseudarthrobacter chlorophenolicus A6]|uniref:Transcriptional regulator, LysR family n=1 Tax=Pseudarthrobacter chlorophenolicus (strain ATCC 700700 / DSM 12829 / CIP 107037 / JCM 12360 / KCTC 9906 / NCIMB 13794 / A6) TaxID=452863 RepID=B8H6I0_PSECP|nr:LysR family transcriptional regulator [Pseudarthrobacter chlorophenolicus]ACL41506.1 transcriptional regulator, LysR family [Pseudarthrobacter chlorophenolicus A6]SDQ62981.1 DNA-binding transcriptional regulator, LysR family [Pseudarthrobacter chlorophenolicus]